MGAQARPCIPPLGKKEKGWAEPGLSSIQLQGYPQELGLGSGHYQDYEQSQSNLRLSVELGTVSEAEYLAQQAGATRACRR